MAARGDLRSQTTIAGYQFTPNAMTESSTGLGAPLSAQIQAAGLISALERSHGVLDCILADRPVGGPQEAADLPGLCTLLVHAARLVSDLNARLDDAAARIGSL